MLGLTVGSGQDGVRRVTWLAVDQLDNPTFALRDVIVGNTRSTGKLAYRR